MAIQKTNAMRILDREGISYESFTYDCNDEFVDGISIASKLSQPVEKVFKTLVTQGSSKEYYVFVIPVAEELNLKKAAKAVNEKSVSMIKMVDINKVTGYIRGGCSPIGMKKNYQTVLDNTAEKFDAIIFSAGKRGTQIMVSSKDLEKLIACKIEDIII